MNGDRPGRSSAQAGPQSARTSLRTIDVNSDVGEGFGNYSFGADAVLMPLITSANIACGYHAGDPLVMRETVELAVRHGVAVGAHPGLPDPLGFGRRLIEISVEDMWAYWTAQLGTLAAFANAAGSRLHHAKPHGAMYTVMAERPPLAEAALDACRAFDPDLLMYFPVLTDVIVAAARTVGVTLVGELYVDLQYSAAGRVIVEREKRGVEPRVAADTLVRYLRDGVIRTVDGTDLSIDAASVCVHGDAPNSVAVAQAIRETLAAEGVAAGAPRTS
jgi:UPF0271 protein